MLAFFESVALNVESFDTNHCKEITSRLQLHAGMSEFMKC